MTRSLFAAGGGLFAGWALVPSLLMLNFARTGFGTSDSTLSIASYAVLCGAWPVGTLVLGLWLDRVWTAIIALAVGVAIGVFVLGIFA